jgi:hypothetical protein
MLIGDSLSMVRTRDPKEQGPLIGEIDLAVPMADTYPVLLQRECVRLFPGDQVYIYNRADRGNGVRDVERDIIYNCIFAGPIL